MKHKVNSFFENVFPTAVILLIVAALIRDFWLGVVMSAVWVTGFIYDCSNLYDTGRNNTKTKRRG